MNREQIIEIIRCGENSHVQFKEHFTTQEQMAEELAAMANAKGNYEMTNHPPSKESHISNQSVICNNCKMTHRSSHISRKRSFNN